MSGSRPAWRRPAGRPIARRPAPKAPLSRPALQPLTQGIAARRIDRPHLGAPDPPTPQAQDQAGTVSASRQVASFFSNEAAACAGLVDGRSTYCSGWSASSGSTWRR